MFTLNDLRTLLHAKPFVPFRIWLSDTGTLKNIYSAEQVWLFRRYAIIGLLDPNTIEGTFDRHAVVRHMHITRCEGLKSGVSPFTSPGEPLSGTSAPAVGS